MSEGLEDLMLISIWGYVWRSLLAGVLVVACIGFVLGRLI